MSHSYLILLTITVFLATCCAQVIPERSVQGGWSGYSHWGSCCGGIRTRSRTCTKPTSPCRGSSCQHERCGTQQVMAYKFARAVMANSVTSREIICRSRPCNAPPGSRCKPQPPVCTTECHYGDRDFLFIIDSSGSIGEKNYKMAKVLLAVIAISLCGNLGTDKQVAAMQFSTNPQKEFAFDEYVDTMPLFDGVVGMNWLNGLTKTWLAFDFARNVMFTVSNGHRPWVNKQALIVTDGKSNSAPGGGPSAGALSIAAAQELKDTGVELFALYIGGPPNDENLEEIRQYVSNPINEHVFSVDGVMSLLDFVIEISLIHERICAC